MADYRALRQRYSLLEICAQPELAVAVTLQPVDAIEVDAAILFSDLLLPFTPMGLDFDFVKGEGPSIERPIRTAEDRRAAAALRAARGARACARNDPAAAPRARPAGCPLIGFGGAPFTLASYAIEGGPSTNYARTKAFMYAQPAAWHRLCARFADDDGRLPHGADRGRRAGDADVRLLGRRARPRRLPRVRAAPHRADLRGAHGQAACRSSTSASARRRFSARSSTSRRRRDWRRLAAAARRGVGRDRPTRARSRATSTRRCCSGRWTASSRPRTMSCAASAGRPGHIFNLGHGVLPSTPLEHVQALARHVHEVTPRREPPDREPLVAPDAIDHRRRRHHRPGGGLRADKARPAVHGARGVVRGRRPHPDRAARRLHHRSRPRIGARAEAGGARSCATSSDLASHVVTSLPPRTAFILKHGRLHPLPSPSVLGIPTTMAGAGRLRSADGRGADAPGGRAVRAAAARRGATSRSAPSSGAASAATRWRLIAEPLLGGIHCRRRRRALDAIAVPPISSTPRRRAAACCARFRADRAGARRRRRVPVSRRRHG